MDNNFLFVQNLKKQDSLIIFNHPNFISLLSKLS